MRLYEPLGTLKPFGEDIWIVDGPVVRMAYFGGSVPFPTRMVVVRLSDGSLFLWSPIEPDEELFSRLEDLGPVRHLVSPNKIHYAHIAAWKRAFPEAKAWASPGVKERAASQDIEVAFDAELGDTAESAWRDDIDQTIFRGSRYMEEVVFFHKKSRTLILADLIENFETERLGRLHGAVARLAGATHPDGKAPLDFRMTFLGRKREARASLARMLEWRPEKVVMAHGRPYERDGAAELQRAFRWV
jgi:hypothetical protein